MGCLYDVVSRGGHPSACICVCVCVCVCACMFGCLSWRGQGRGRRGIRFARYACIVRGVRALSAGLGPGCHSVAHSYVQVETVDVSEFGSACPEQPSAAVVETPVPRLVQRKCLTRGFTRNLFACVSSCLHES